jgi:predicted nucleotidyltransferase
MTRTEALTQLKECAPAVRARGVTSLYLFGSRERDEAGPASDLDIFVDYDPAQRFSLLDLAGIKNMLERQLAIEVDVTTRDSLHPLLRDDIERSAIRVF